MSAKFGESITAAMSIIQASLGVKFFLQFLSSDNLQNTGQKFSTTEEA